MTWKHLDEAEAIVEFAKLYRKAETRVKREQIGEIFDKHVADFLEALQEAMGE
jgi:hypothetical protein